MIVYGVSGSPYTWRALLALETKGLAYELRMLGEAEGGLDSPELALVNPRRTVPTLRDGDLVITDSLAILAYVERIQPSPPLFGDGARAAGAVWQALTDFSEHVEAHSKAIVKAFYAGEAELRRAEIAREGGVVRAELGRIEQALLGPWMTGEQLTAADLMAYPFLKSFFRAAARPEAASHDLGVLPLRETFPRIERWMRRIEALPSYDRTYPPEWKKAERPDAPAPKPLEFPKPGDELRIAFDAFGVRLSLRSGQLRLLGERGQNAGFSDDVDYALERAGDSVALLSWTERVGTTVVHAIDLARRSTRATVVKPGGAVERLVGAVEKVLP